MFYFTLIDVGFFCVRISVSHLLSKQKALLWLFLPFSLGIVPTSLCRLASHFQRLTDCLYCWQSVNC